MKQGLIFDIKRYSINDGPGIRTTIFFKGCPLKCRWCHNPESQNRCPEKFGDNEIIGEEKKVGEIIREIEKETVFYDESKGGVTFSGGEPLVQPEFLAALLDECQKKEIHTVLDTSGGVPPSVFNTIIDKVDLFLYDLKIMDEKKHIAYTGQSNRNILKNLKTLSKKGKRVIIRFPIIPGITDTNENIEELCDFVSTLKNIDEIDLIPYHRIAESKYKRMNLENRMTGVQAPTNKRINEIKNEFKKHTHNIEIKKI